MLGCLVNADCERVLMNHLDHVIDSLAREQVWRYNPTSEPAAEPTALAAVALAAHGRQGAAERARVWLAQLQNADGSVGLRAADPTPGWCTALAVLAWKTCEPSADCEDYSRPVRQAVDWMLSIAGETSAPQEEAGHDTTLAGWPWVAETHSWVEPTAQGLLALKAVGQGDHPRAREAARLLEDRLLESGGCNYGNTIVLGQQLLPHVQPTGWTLVALADEGTTTPKVMRSLDYLERELGRTTSAASLAYGLMGLAAFDHWPNGADGWLVAAASGALRRGASHEMALLALAGLKRKHPFPTGDRQVAPSIS